MEGFDPKIVVFCCENSAFRALQGAQDLGLDIPTNIELISVPCSGKVQSADVLSVFEQGADGVLVLGCHTDACKYLVGNKRVQKCLERVQSLLSDIEIEPERVQFESLAPNMAYKFVQKLEVMVGNLQKLGPCMEGVMK
jgi:F420-non-reducing hydrogenase iron-sulfur subunit